MNSVTFHELGGAKLALYEWVPDKVDAVLFYISGMQSHGAWVKETANYLGRSAIAVFVLDRKGAGLSEGKRGDIASADALLSEYAFIIKKIKNRYSKLPFVLLGQSMGGSILAALLTRKYFDVAVDGLVFCASGLGKRHFELSEEEYESRMQDRGESLLPINLPIEAMTDQKNYQELIEKDDLKLTHFTKTARSELLKLEKMYWELELDLRGATAVFVRPYSDPLIDLACSEAIFNRLTGFKGLNVCFPSDRHYLWFSDQRHKLMRWLKGFILSAGYGGKNED